MMNKQKKRSLKTVFLALFATASFVGSAIVIFDVEPQLMWQFFLVSLLGLGILIAAAFCVVGLKVLIQRWLGS